MNRLTSRLQIYMLILLALVAGFLGATLATIISAHASGSTIYACVNSNKGNVRIISPTGTCGNNETALSWNDQGPAGPAGSSAAFCVACDLRGDALGLGDLFAGKNFTGAFFR